MSTFEEYAALARQLAHLRRLGERDATADARQRENVQAVADQLGQRLTVQQHRLWQFGHLIGQQRPASVSPPATPLTVTAPAVHQSEFVSSQLSTGPARLALPPASTGASGSAPDEGGLDLPSPRPPSETDPAVELHRARQAADEADHAVSAAEALAQQPPLLPTWSPLARAMAVYTACALAAGVLMLMLVLASGVGVVDTFTLYAWTCAGLPAVAFFAGVLLLGRYGRPVAANVAVSPPRYVHFGFAICFLALPILYCGYLLLFRLLRLA